jgi:cyanophycin synthetase
LWPDEQGLARQVRALGHTGDVLFLISAQGAESSLVQAVQAMPASRRSVVISGAGDRRDQDIRQQTQILGDAFDEVVMFEDQCQRGRKDGEVLALLREGLAQAKRTTQKTEVFGEFLAIDMALDKLQAGELCLVLVDQVEEAIAHIAAKVAAAT